MKKAPWLSPRLLPLLPLIATIALLETLSRAGSVPAYLMPSPLSVFRALTVESGDLWQAAAATGFSATLGFSLSLLAGLLAGVALSSAPWIQRTFYPYAVFFQTVPIISIAPLLVIWFGYGMPTVVASAFIVSIFPVIASTMTGLRSTDRALVDLFALYGAGARDRFFKLRLPFALPHILSGARVASGLAVVGAIVGEFIAGGGLGGIVDEARTQQRIDRMFAAVLLASLLGLIFFRVLDGAGIFLLRHWHASEQNQGHE